MGKKTELLVLFLVVLVLFVGINSFENAEAIKSKGNSLTETTSKQVCGNFMCDEPMSIAEKIAAYLLNLAQQEEPETNILQQAFLPGSFGGERMGSPIPPIGERSFQAPDLKMAAPQIGAKTFKSLDVKQATPRDVKASKLAGNLIQKFDLKEDRLSPAVAKIAEKFQPTLDRDKLTQMRIAQQEQEKIQSIKQFDRPVVKKGEMEVSQLAEMQPQFFQERAESSLGAILAPREFTVSDENSCKALPFNSGWDSGNRQCVFGGVTIAASDVINMETSFRTHERIENFGTLNLNYNGRSQISGVIKNFGTLNNAGEMYSLGGTIDVQPGGTLINSGHKSSAITVITRCEGTVINSGGIAAFGTLVVQRCWDGGGDGVYWSDPANWSSDVLPSPTEQIIIDNAAGTVHFNIATFSTGDGLSAFTVVSGNTFEIDAGTTFVNRAGYVPQGFVDDGFLETGATLINRGNFILEVGSQSGNRGTIDNHGILTIDSSGFKNVNGVINNFGTIDIFKRFQSDPNSEFNNKPGSKLNIKPEAYFDMRSTDFLNEGTITNDGNFISSTTLSNKGIIINNGLFKSNIRIHNDGGTFTNNDTLEINTGYGTNKRLMLKGGSTLNNYGTITIQSSLDNHSYLDNTINNYGTITVQSGGDIDNDGTINNYGTISNSGTITNDGSICGGVLTGNLVTGNTPVKQCYYFIQPRTIPINP